MIRFRDNNGFTFVEVLVGTTVFLIVAASIYSLFSLSLKWVGSLKARVQASSIAQEQLEIVRNMPYDNIKTTFGWVPPGLIPSVQTITRNGTSFQITVNIAYVNDPFDGTSATSVPPDLLPFDYKKIEVKVSWSGPFGANKPITFDTFVSPKGLEGLSPGRGGIWIKAFDAQGNAVANANTHIENINFNPDYIVDTFTDSSGNVFLTDLEPDNQNYQVQVSKAGYSAERTYSVADLNGLGYPGATSEKPSLTVVAGQVTESSFSIDLLSNFVINTINENVPDEFKVSTDTSASDQDLSHLAIDSSDKLYFVWHDKRDGAAIDRNYGQKYNVSKNKLFTSDVQLHSANNQQNPRVAMGIDGNFFVTWYDSRTGNQDVYLSKFSSANGFDLWSGGNKINTDVGSADQVKSDIAIDNSGNVLISWIDNRNEVTNNDIYLGKFDDNDGHSLWAGEIKVNSDVGNNNQSDSIVLADKISNDVYVAWSDNRNGNWDVYMNKFDTNGTRLWASDVKVNTNMDVSNQSFPDAVLDSLGNIYVVWSDDRNGITNLDIYAQKYDSNGVRASTGVWVGGDLKINSDTTTSKQDTPSITIDGGNNFFVAWSDERNSNLTGSDIYLQKFNSDGARIWTEDQRVNSDLGLYTQSNPELAVLGDGRVVIVWQDGRNTDLDIYAAIYSEPGTMVRADVPLKMYITKQIGIDNTGAPIYKYITNFLTDASGVFNLNNVEWGNYRIEVTGGLYTLVSTVPLQPVTLNPNSSQTVKVNAEP